MLCETRRFFCAHSHGHQFYFSALIKGTKFIGNNTFVCFEKGRNPWLKQFSNERSSSTISNKASERNYSLNRKNEIKTLDQFFAQPKAFDAVSFINQKDLNFSEALRVYNAIKPQDKTINLVCAMIFNCQRNNQTKTMKDLLQLLVEKLENFKNVEQRKNQHVKDHTWNGVLTALCINSEYENHAVEWFFFLLNNKVAKLYEKTFGLIMNILSRNGNVEKCKEVMELMRNEQVPLNVFHFSMMMKALIKANRLSEAISLLEDMERHGVQPDGTIFSTLLSACADCDAEEHGRKIHEIINSRGLLNDLNVNNSLINFYATRKDSETAQSLFEQMRRNKAPMDVITWNSMIKALILSDRLGEAAKLLQEMEKCNIQPNSVTFTTLLSGCAATKSFDIGQHMHWLIESKGFTDCTNVSNALLNFYIKCNRPELAETLFTEMLRDGKSTDIISWNYYLNALILSKKWNTAIDSIKEMEKRGVEPNSTTFVTLLNACTDNTRIEEGKHIYSMTQTTQKFSNNAAILNVAIRFFESCGDNESALAIYENKMNPREVFSETWHCITRSMIACNKLSSAISAIESHKKTGLKVDHNLLITMVHACTMAKSLEYGKRVHKLATSKGISNCLPLNNALINFYVQLNDIESAISLLNNMLQLHAKGKPFSFNTESYNYILEGYSQRGLITKILPLFKGMVANGIKPTEQTFTSILRACTIGESIDGHTEKALSIYNDMERFFGVKPTREHATLLLDLLIKEKRYNEAEMVIMNGPLAHDHASWLAVLLNACQGVDTERADKIRNLLKEGTITNECKDGKQ
ncbi:hypothetical protein FDP41_000940 [Naegleria fowleri]|uniref:Pentatricopeptide repeat-containing protein-mitochondrial domain-containing protein n=1 Tax=Naegleria fowleri TaxID=5763 RepID=A0A6A5BRI4_NAEFO|nr:uncharacterized protein FDP41_000940 [Naegleria fowleri]KAF0979787.1 hypothetical protein FDP41_000940 [Naegleria fowleri]CAG4708251.1 unnamed protein product [Naegleria fowleri]